ncbi:hypothetical protein LQ50_10015 [Halalkalibacter okhensis]|uniref:Uncharacterized protein n=1 Tax=Halalkalibacter okhensis TaxID=333138 RepID=A0A0B0IHJ6_9BACI|nr:hypothetical protein LQ50_10015 [Halalkalibacter okhensis]
MENSIIREFSMSFDYVSESVMIVNDTFRIVVFKFMPNLCQNAEIVANSFALYYHGYVLV